MSALLLKAPKLSANPDMIYSTKARCLLDRIQTSLSWGVSRIMLCFQERMVLTLLESGVISTGGSSSTDIAFDAEKVDSNR